jgi:mono/diheme cytochrome c family protein
MKILIALNLAAAAAFGAASAPTFTKDVAPILFNRCAECHRPGEAGPMPLLTYKEVRPWAKAIKNATLARTMPPWSADPAVGHFSNDRRLSDAELNAIVKWVDGGAPEGNPKDLPKLPQFVAGWQIGKPDLIVDTGTEFKIPAEGVVDYKYFNIDPKFTEDKWIQALEVRPEQRRQVHHILVFVREGGKPARRAGEQFSDMAIGYAPGVPSLTFDSDTGFLIKAGSTLQLQVHYTTNGKEATDRSAVGFKFRTTTPKYQAFSGSATQTRFAIPAGDPNYEVKASWVFREDATLLDMTPHMHLRGKAFKYKITYPDGKSEELLSVPKYEFNWQLAYVLAEPRKVPAGSRIDATAWYDNSANNKYNPDPSKVVHWGDQTFQEMMIGFFNYTVPVGTLAPQVKKPATSAAARP